MKKGFYLILILLFPSIIYILFSLGEHNVKRLGFYGKFALDENGDTFYLPVIYPDLIAASGDMINNESLRGKAVIIDLFNLPCDDQCANHFNTLANYLNGLEQKDKWQVLSICLDSVSPSILKDFLDNVYYEGDNWVLASGEKGEGLKRFLHEVYLDNGRVSNLNELPSNEFVLIDQQGRIREYFDSRFYQENKKMEDVVKMVLKDPHLSWKEKSYEKRKQFE